MTSRLLVAVLAVAMLITMMPAVPGSYAYAESGSLDIKTPEVVVTGSNIIGGTAYTKDNVGLERSYTRDELKALEGGTDVQYSSVKNQSPFTKLLYRASGVYLSSLLAGTAFDPANDVLTLLSNEKDPWVVNFDPSLSESVNTDSGMDLRGFGEQRYFFPGVLAELPDDPEASEPMLAWASDNDSSADPGSAGPEKKYLTLVVGQEAVTERNNRAYGKYMTYITSGDDLNEVVLTVGSNSYTRRDILMMDFAEGVYKYTSKKGEMTDSVRGVPFSVLLNGEDGSSSVSFEAADGYDMSSATKTVQELIDGNYMLAYEVNGNGVYESNEDGYGFLTLYGDGAKPSKMINKITVTSSSGEDYSKSPYKHITNGGQGGDAPYNIDAITGATLTVEGPGVTTSVPVSVKDLEGRDSGVRRADYTDERDGADAVRKYEGIDLYFILHNMTSGESGIKLTDTAKKVLIKNRNRNTIAEFTLDQIEEAHNSETPIIVAYGTSLKDGSNIRPFVFNGAAGADPVLGNEDGCIKLVYNKASITGDKNTDYTKFGNMAYIYVAEADTPGYKHDKDPYQSPEISNYVLTVTGDKIGREVNYRVQDLENMVGYDAGGKPDNSGMGYRDEYSLANSTYWYVNEYEGVQLWKLLLRSGADPSLANDENTIVSSTATDGYPSTDKFTAKQVADPDSFGFYEKNPADLNDGKYEGNENIRQGDDVSTGDKLRTGYPVLVAYGVNGYPYVEKSSQDGYISGLQNDGGPLRIISGKLKYNHANGSNQAKLLDKIIVGENTYHYSTHKYHSDKVYTDLAENSTVEIKILNGADADAPVLKEKTYKVGDIEEIIYGGSLSVNQLKAAKVKTYYQLAKGSSSYSDLYEGIDLNYFLKEVVELPGYKGTITFSNGSDELSLSLEDVLATVNGSNTETGMDGLAPVLAYGKNGAPMVADKNAEGYQNKITLAEGTDYQNQIAVKNDGGPLAVLFPHTDSSVSDKSLTNISSITINLSADKYAHTKEPYDTYAGYTINIGGEGTRLGAEGKDFTLSELEGKQTIAFTGDYSILKDGAAEATQTRYRGINLYSLLTSSAVGLKSNADKVIIKTSDDKSVEFTLSDIRKKYMNSITGDSDLPVLLAYGTGKAGDADKEDGMPLVADKNEAGYVSEYGNSGGPVRLVVGQAEAGDVNSGKNQKFVKSIEVTASEMTSWNHNSAEVYKQYRDEKVQLVVNDKAGKTLFDKTFTVGEIEDNTALVERVTANVVQEFTWEGINFWRWVKQEVGSAADLSDPVTVTVAAADGYSQEIRAKFGVDGLENGIKDGSRVVPIIMAYGVGGYPLVIGDKTYPTGEGYDATAGNDGGPLRLVTHNSQGTSLTYLTKITIVAGEGGSVEPEEPGEFTIKGLKSGDIKMTVADIKEIKNSAGDSVGQATGTYIRKGVTKTVRGILLKNLLSAKGIENENTVMTLNTPDAFETTEKGASYNNITLKTANAQKYFLAYQEKDAETGEWKDIDDVVKGTDIHTNFRMYRYYCDATEGADNQNDWYDECSNVTAITLDVPEVTAFKEYPTKGGVRSTWVDDAGTTWVGTYGGGLYCKEAGEDEFEVLNTSSTPAMKTDFTSAVAADAEGGIWVSQNASYTDPTGNQGVLYIKDGEVTQYLEGTDPATIPNNYVQAIKVDTDGKVWFGSFGGLTIHDPAAGTWTTYSKADKGFPASSINTIVLDGEGGAWLGFYPEGSGTSEDPYTGGFCHIDKDGNVDKIKTETGDTQPMFAQIWSRSIAIDKKGTVWAVAAGTNLDDNVGGVVWKWQSGKDEPSRYTGKELFPEYLDGSSTTEVRVVSVDKDGNLWFGTSADGVLKVSNPKLNSDGTMNVDAQYAKETGSWSAATMNNVYSIDFWNDGTAYVGTSGGLLVLGNEPGEKDVIGGETKETAQFIVDGKGTVKNGYFSIKSLKNAEGVNKVTAEYSWLNKSGTAGKNSFQGVYLDNLLREVIGLKDNAYKMTVIASDGYSKTFDLYRIDETDIDGNKIMIAWQSDEDPDNTKINPKLVVGQMSPEDKNKSSWIGDVSELRIDVASAEDIDAADQARAAAIEEITAYAEASTVSEEHKDSVAAIRDSVIEELNASQYAKQIADILSKGKGRIDAVSTVEEKEEELAGKNEEAAAAESAADEAQAEAAKAADNGDEEAVKASEEAVTAAEEALSKAEAAEATANEALEAAKIAGDEALIAEATAAAGAAGAETLIQKAKLSTAKTTASRAKAAKAKAAAVEAAATPGPEAIEAAKAAQAAAAETAANAEQAVKDAEAALAAAGDDEAKAKAQGVLDAAKAAKAAADIAQADADFEELREEAKNTLVEVAEAAKEGLSEEAAAKVDAELQGALAQIAEVKGADSLAPIAAKLANDINRTAETEKEKALADKKEKAMQEVLDHLEENLVASEEAAMTRAALEAIVAINNAKDADSIESAKNNAVAALDKIVTDYKTAVTPPGKPKIKVKNTAKKTARVKWKKVAGAAGYEVYRSTKKTKGFKKVKTTTAVKFVNKKLKKGKTYKTYYYKVRAYKVYNGKKIYGKFSKVKKVKIIK